MSNFVKVSGKKYKDIVLYALSTCIWCRQTKNLLDSLGIEYSYIYVDLLDKETKEKIIQEIKTWNPRCSFPTLVFDNKKCIIGYDELEIKKELNNGSNT